MQAILAPSNVATPSYATVIAKTGCYDGRIAVLKQPSVQSEIEADERYLAELRASGVLGVPSKSRVVLPPARLAQAAPAAKRPELCWHTADSAPAATHPVARRRRVRGQQSYRYRPLRSSLVQASA